MGWFIYVYMGISGAFEPAPSKPVIRHGEFPFRLEYEINGEVKVIEDTLIFDYRGTRNTGAGKVRNWVRTFSSGATDVVLLEVEDPVETWSGIPIEQTVRYPVGTGSYYMEGPYEDKGEENDSYRYAVVYSKFADGSRLESSCYPDELYEDFKIRIISWEIAEPIANTFK